MIRVPVEWEPMQRFHSLVDVWNALELQLHTPVLERTAQAISDEANDILIANITNAHTIHFKPYTVKRYAGLNIYFPENYIINNKVSSKIFFSGCIEKLDGE